MCYRLLQFLLLRRFFHINLQGRRISQARNEETLLATCFSLVSCLVCFEDGGEIFLRNVGLRSAGTTGRCIPENTTLHNYSCESLKSYIASADRVCGTLVATLASSLEATRTNNVISTEVTCLPPLEIQSLRVTDWLTIQQLNLASVIVDYCS
jgi:hypothetical protein